MSNENEKAALRSELALLKSRIAEIEAKLAVPAAARRDDSGPRVLTVLEQTAISASKNELARLFDVVSRAYPAVRAVGDREEDLFGRFVAAFRFVQSMSRRPETDRTHTLSWWLEEAKGWLTERRINPTLLRGPDFLLAAIACGDVPFIIGDSSMGQLWEVGLARWGGTRPASEAWRKVLGGNLPTPLPARSPSWATAVQRFGVAI